MAIVVCGRKDGKNITELFTLKDENTIVNKSVSSFKSLNVTSGVSEGSSVLVQSDDNLVLFNLEHKEFTKVCEV